MKIYDAKDQLLLEVEVDDTSYRYRTIGGDHNLVVKYSLPEHIELPVGAYVQYDGAKYVLKRPQDFKMQQSRRFDYTVTFESPQADAKIWKFRNPVDGRLKFSLTAKPHEHLQMFVDNMNRRDTGWTMGECIDGTEKVINYDHDYCWAALGKMASEFNTEFEIKGKQVSLKKVEYNKSNPLPLAYGCGNGFTSGVGRTNSGDKPPVEILYVQGGEDNIDPSKYGNKELLLPTNQTIAYDGEHFEDEIGFIAENARLYMVDDMGLSIRRADKELTSLCEDSLDATEIYPKRVGKVTRWVEVDKGGHLYDFVDNTIPPELDFSKCMIEGETPTVIFQTGMLAGREFEVTYFHDPKGEKLGRRFEITPQEIDGVLMPDETFKAQENDTYAVFHYALPDSYIRNDSDKSGASWDMFREAVKYLYDNEEQKYSFTGTLDGLWAKKDWLNIGGRIILGGFVLFRDDNFLEEGVLIRITGIKDYINKPHSPTIELSNETKSTSYSTGMANLVSQEVHVDETYKSAVQFTKRRFRDAKETITMLEQALFDNFTNSINPITVQTMSALVGDESLQYRFVDNATDPHTVAHLISYDQENKQLSADGGLMQHMTLGIKDVSSSHKADEYKFWRVAPYTSARLENADTAYYFYIKANRDNEVAEFMLSEKAIKMESDASVYYFLCGILNKEYDGERSFVTLYGFTEILPGRITTDRIVSGDGDSFFDMVANAMKLGDRLSFNVNGDGQLKLRGTIVQSESGDEDYIGCYRGVWNEDYIYYQGDEVIYEFEGCTSLYRYINAAPSRGHKPTETLYWQVQAQGSKGADGADGISPNTAFKSTVFIRSNKSPQKPEGGSYANPVPDGWSDGIPAGEEKVWASTRVFSSDGLPPQEDEWTEPRQMTDTADFDVEFSSVEAPNAPTGHPNTNPQWSNESNESTIWMATSRKSNGVWEDWQISRIKGEKGEDGSSIKVQGNFQEHYKYLSDWNSATSEHGTFLFDEDTSKEEGDPDRYCVIRQWGIPRVGAVPGWMTKYAAEGDAYIMQNPSSLNDGCLFVAESNRWVNAGRIKGADGLDGIDGKNAYMHVKYANSLTKNDWSANNGETPSKYIGTYCDNNPADQLVWELYQWVKWQGEDGFGYEYIYQRTATPLAPALPSTSLNINGYVPTDWNADPIDVTAAYPYCWVAYRQKVNGVWSAWKGSATSPTRAALWAKFGKDGEDGQNGQYTELRYRVNGSPTAAPSVLFLTTDPNHLNPYAWTTKQPSVGVAQFLWMIQAVKSGDGNSLIEDWSAPVRITPVDGKDGEDGKTVSPVLVFRGDYKSTEKYYGNETRVDCVRASNGQYYIARIDAKDGVTGFSYPPINAQYTTDYWRPFGANFESVATDLLLAQYANIGNMIFKDGKLISQAGTVNGAESTDYQNPDFVPNIVIDGVTGNLSFVGKTRTPFKQHTADYGNFALDWRMDSSNLMVYTPSSQAGTTWVVNVGASAAGMRFCITNFKYMNGSAEATSTKPFGFMFQKGAGTYSYYTIWEEGQSPDTQLMIMPGEMVEFVIYGTTSRIFGVIVLNRRKLV